LSCRARSCCTRFRCASCAGVARPRRRNCADGSPNVTADSAEGSGLAIRRPGEISREKLHVLRLADEIYIAEIRRAGRYDDIWQTLAALPPVKTVGVMGDFRTYDDVVGLRPRLLQRRHDDGLPRLGASRDDER
jgi:hypothetical protein